MSNSGDEEQMLAADEALTAIDRQQFKTGTERMEALQEWRKRHALTAEQAKGMVDERIHSLEHENREGEFLTVCTELLESGMEGDVYDRASAIWKERHPEEAVPLQRDEWLPMERALRE